jgi:hypothetical protein
MWVRLLGGGELGRRLKIEEWTARVLVDGRAIKRRDLLCARGPPLVGDVGAAGGGKSDTPGISAAERNGIRRCRAG